MMKSRSLYLILDCHHLCSEQNRRPFLLYLPLTIDAFICLIIVLKWRIACVRCFVAICQRIYVTLIAYHNLVNSECTEIYMSSTPPEMLQSDSSPLATTNSSLNWS